MKKGSFHGVASIYIEIRVVEPSLNSIRFRNRHSCSESTSPPEYQKFLYSIRDRLARANLPKGRQETLIQIVQNHVSPQLRHRFLFVARLLSCANIRSDNERGDERADAYEAASAGRLRLGRWSQTSYDENSWSELLPAQCRPKSVAGNRHSTRE